MSFKSIQTVHSTHHHMYTIFEMRFECLICRITTKQSIGHVNLLQQHYMYFESKSQIWHSVCWRWQSICMAYGTTLWKKGHDFLYLFLSNCFIHKSDSSGKHIFSWVFILVLVRMSLYAKQCQNQHFPFDARLAFYEHAYFVCLCETTKDEVKNCICDGTTIRAKIYKHKRA